MTNVDKKLMSDSVVCLWLLVVQSSDRCHWRPLSGRQILLAQSAVSVIFSPPPPPLSLSLSFSFFLSSLSQSISIYLDLILSIALSQSLPPPPPPPPLSLSPSLSLTHSLCLCFAFHSQAHQCICMVAQVTVFCSASLLMPLDATQTLVLTDGRALATEKETVNSNLCYLQC